MKVQDAFNTKDMGKKTNNESVMNTFPIVVTMLKDGEVTTKHESIQTPKDISKSGVRSAAIRHYEKTVLHLPEDCLCWECSRGPLDCEKMGDISKKMIFDYPFITEGYQIQDVYQNESDLKYSDLEESCEYERTARHNNLRIERFVVRKCKNFR